MATVRLVERTGKDGVLHLQIPVGQPDAEFEAIVVLHPKATTLPTSTTEKLGWPAGYFEKTFGSIDDETFMRQPQGEYPKPAELD
ncbi:MAG: hypothetical protein L0Y72_25500 [Gemmataceae bacterium]|nr:hypothetical protein [Gemmataceae bacterium]MCI0742402.1 hypothetical protein [Gemmataceae bacterium]